MKRAIALVLVLAMVVSLMVTMTGCDALDSILEMINPQDDEPVRVNDRDDKDKDEDEDRDDPVEETEEKDAVAEAETEALPTEVPTEPPVEVAAAVPLHELPIISEDKNMKEKDVEDAYGNTYEGPYFDLCSYGKSNTDGEYITMDATEFNAGGDYRYLTGTFFARDGQAESYTIEFMIYADDELVYCSEPIGRKVKAVDFAVDIGNCDVLRITSRSYEYTGSGTNPGIILVGAEVTNDYDGELTEGVEINPDLVSLFDLHVYGTHSKVLSNTDVGAVEDSYGNVYKCIYADLCSYGNYGGKEFDTQAYTDYVANGEYRYLSGTFFTRTKQSEKYQIEFLIYADDELVYSSGMIDRSTKAIDFVVDIGNCDMIRIMSRSVNYTDSGTNPGIILVNAVVSTQEP